ncbi:hypothetical protein P9112_010843 [Eukaryota sp. TZLM1-RC]
MSSDLLKTRVDALRRQVVTLQLYSLSNDNTSAVTLRSQILNESLDILNSVGADTRFLDGADPNDPSTFTPDVSLICRIRRAINSTSQDLQSSNEHKLPSSQETHHQSFSQSFSQSSRDGSPVLSPSSSPQRAIAPQPEIPASLASMDSPSDDEFSNVFIYEDDVAEDQNNVLEGQNHVINELMTRQHFGDDVASLDHIAQYSPRSPSMESHLTFKDQGTKNQNSLDKDVEFVSVAVQSDPQSDPQSNSVDACVMTNLPRRNVGISVKQPENVGLNVLEDDVLSLRAAIAATREYLEALEKSSLEILENINKDQEQQQQNIQDYGHLLNNSSPKQKFNQNASYQNFNQNTNQKFNQNASHQNANQKFSQNASHQNANQKFNQNASHQNFNQDANKKFNQTVNHHQHWEQQKVSKRDHSPNYEEEPKIRQNSRRSSPESTRSRTTSPTASVDNSPSVVEARRRAARRAAERRRKEKEEHEKKEKHLALEMARKQKEREMRIKEFEKREKSRPVSRNRSRDQSKISTSRPSTPRSVSVELNKKALETPENFQPNFQVELTEEESQIFEQIERQLVR